MTQPFALMIRGAPDLIFELSDQLGFDSEMQALAVSIFEDGPDRMYVQALYSTEKEAEAARQQLQIPDTCECFITRLPDEDWVSKSQAGLPPVRAGRFWVYGSHDAGTIPADVTYPLLVDAGLAFGTGHHGTTKGCLIIFDHVLETGFQPESVLDLGCGAGTLAIAAAKALERTILATDIDPDAVSVTRDNAQTNDVTTYIRAVVADGFDAPELKDTQFDLIFANILAGPLMGLAPNIAKALRPNGYVILSGIVDEQAQNVTEAFQAHNINITPYPSIEGWTSLLGQKLIAEPHS